MNNPRKTTHNNTVGNEDGIIFTEKSYLKVRFSKNLRKVFVFGKGENYERTENQVRKELRRKNHA